MKEIGVSWATPKVRPWRESLRKTQMFLVSAFSSLEGSGSPWWLVGDVEINLGSFNRSGKYLTLNDIPGPRELFYLSPPRGCRAKNRFTVLGHTKPVWDQEEKQRRQSFSKGHLVWVDSGVGRSEKGLGLLGPTPTFLIRNSTPAHCLIGPFLWQGSQGSPSSSLLLLSELLLLPGPHLLSLGSLPRERFELNCLFQRSNLFILRD